MNLVICTGIGLFTLLTGVGLVLGLIWVVERSVDAFGPVAATEWLAKSATVCLVILALVGVLAMSYNVGCSIIHLTRAR